MAQRYKSVFAAPVTMQNFCPQISVKLAVTASSAPTPVVPALTSQGRTTFKISNTGTKTAYIAWGHNTATAVASNTSTWETNCDAVPAGSILTQDFINNDADTNINMLAAICAGGESTTLEITYGSGQ